MYDVLIVGGGAAGLAAACFLARGGCRVAVMEKQNRVGRKLLSTGNGRCNLTNLRATQRDYHGTRAAAARALELCPPEAVIGFFEALGLPVTADAEGRVYPMSNQAASVLDALRLAAEERGCELLTQCPAALIHPETGGFSVVTEEGRTFRGRRVLVCTGGMAAPKLGGGVDGYRLLKALGHRITTRFPAIAALKVNTETVRALKGQRAACAVKLVADGKILREERGELLFAEAALSGIAVMQLARDCGEALQAKRVCAVSIDFLPDESDAAARIRERIRRIPRRSMEDFLNGIVSKRIGQSLVRAARIEPLSREAGSLTEAEESRLAGVLKDWSIPVTGVMGFEHAQVTAGGVSLGDFHWDTLESSITPGLYAAGELLDVDGDCGGFNLQWAWSSALMAAKAIEAARKEEGR